MLPEVNIEAIVAELKRSAPRRIAEQIADLRRIAAESLAKVDAEGTVVRTLKGDVIAHPSIKIHSDAIKAEAAMLKDWAASRSS